MAASSYRKIVEDYDDHYFYEDIGNLQEKYQFIRELLTISKKKLKDEEKNELKMV